MIFELEIKSKKRGYYVVNVYQKMGNAFVFIGVYSGLLYEIKNKIANTLELLPSQVIFQKSIFQGWY